MPPPAGGDQSFWGHGIPSLFMTLSEQPAGDSETARAYALLMGGAANERRARLVVAHHGGHAGQTGPGPRWCAMPRCTSWSRSALLEDLVLPLDYRAG